MSPAQFKGFFIDLICKFTRCCIFMMVFHPKVYPSGHKNLTLVEKERKFINNVI